MIHKIVINHLYIDHNIDLKKQKESNAYLFGILRGGFLVQQFHTLFLSPFIKVIL